MTQTEQREIADKVRAMAIFCLERKGRCFADWNGAKVFQYLAWNFLNGTVFVVYEGAKIKALAIAFRVMQLELTLRDTECHVFDWKRLHQEGDCTLISHVFGTRSECRTLQNMIIAKWPESKEQPFMTYRLGKLHRIPDWRFCV